MKGADMSDLISRSDTMNRLRNYAEQKHCNGEVELANGILKAICFIEEEENIPTVYNVEKVVAELDNKFEQTVAEILDKTGSDFTIADFNVKRYSDRICEIVRKGGTT